MKKIGLKWDTIVTDWKRTEKKSLRRQMLSDSQWGQLNREVNMRNMISTVGLKKKKRLRLQWTDVKMKLFLKTMKTIVCGSI